MLSIKSKIKKYIIVIGGWDCNEVEYINFVEMNKWISLPRMKYKRNAPTFYFFDNKFIYVFRGLFTKKNELMKLKDIKILIVKKMKN